MYGSYVFVIRVQGEIGQNWSDYFCAQSLSVELDTDGFPVTTLTSEPVDQAGLLGIINCLNGMRLPLLSVECLLAPVESKPSGIDLT